MIEFRVAEAEVIYEYMSGLGSYPAIQKEFVKVLAEAVNDGWQVHTVDLVNEKALLEREVQ